MFRRFSVNFAVFSIVLDAGIVVTSLAFAARIRPSLNNVGFLLSVGDEVTLPWVLYLLFAFIWVSVFLAASIYDGRKNFRVIEELSSLSWGILLAAVASAGVLYLSYRDVSRALFILFVLLAGVFIVGWRMFYRWLLRMIPDGNGKRRVLIVGNGEAGRSVKVHIEENPTFGLDFAGFVGEGNGEDAVGGYDQIRQLVQAKAIEDIVIALPRKDSHRVGEIAASLLEVPVNLWVIPDYYSLALHKAGVEEYAGLTMLDLRAPALNDYQRMIKRALDLLGALLLLPLTIPLMILVGLLILIFDPGPIFFNQERAGENGKPFTMHKFRTMVANAEKIRKAMVGSHKQKGDPRVTRLGRILRKTSLDEIPQLFNVIKGEMSFVGPRPELLDLVEKYEPWQRARFAIPPGITGWWQVNGRSDRPMHLNTEDDIYYLNNYSLWLDLQIIVRTIWVVLIGRGAY